MAKPELPCSGCAHSASGVRYPGHNSGERPCCFCVRNLDADPTILSSDTPLFRNSPHGKKFFELGGKVGEGVWYDGTPAIKTPMDCYITIDMQRQYDVFKKGDKK